MTNPMKEDEQLKLIDLWEEFAKSGWIVSASRVPGRKWTVSCVRQTPFDIMSDEAESFAQAMLSAKQYIEGKNNERR